MKKVQKNKRLIIKILDYGLLAAIGATIFSMITSTMISLAYGETNYPKHSNYINDYANVIPDDKEEILNKKIQTYDEKTSNQLAVLTIKKLGDESIEDYSVHVFEQWKPGQKGKDNGALFVFAMEDRKMRLEVGRGLEDDITDVEAKHVLDDAVRPQFKEEHYAEGVDAGIDAAIKAIAENEESASNSAAATTNDNIPPWLVIILFVVIIGVVISAISYSPYTSLGGSGGYGFGPTWGSSSSGSIFSSDDSDSDSGSSSSSGSGFGGFGGGSSSGGGASSSW